MILTIISVFGVLGGLVMIMGIFMFMSDEMLSDDNKKIKRRTNMMTVLIGLIIAIISIILHYLLN